MILSKNHQKIFGGEEFVGVEKLYAASAEPSHAQQKYFAWTDALANKAMISIDFMLFPK